LIKKACKNNILKVIIETALLSNQEKINACKCINKAKADFIKTSTGFSTSGANIEDIKLFKKYISPKTLIKAAGGIKTKQDMIDMINAGANRIGTSNGVGLII
jgi:deoxyribose-phosphate aldolase